MTLNELINNSYFLKLLDKGDSREMALYLSDLANLNDFESDEAKKLENMFNDLQIFTDAGVKSIENKKFIVSHALLGCHDRTIDLQNKILAPFAVYLPKNSLIVLDDTTTCLTEQKKLKCIEIDVSAGNIIKFCSLPKDNLFYFSAYSSREPTIKFKVNKNITNFEDYLKSQYYFTLGYYGKPLTREAVINDLLQHIEYI